MKHIKTFENVISDIFKKRKKLPPIVVNFGDKLVAFINKAKNDYRCVYIDSYQMHKDTMQILSIMVEDSNYSLPRKVVGLYYNDSNNLIMLAIINNYDYVEIKNYIISILENEKYSQKIKSNISGDRYFIKIDKIEELINDINIDDFNLFIQTEKYNL